MRKNRVSDKLEERIFLVVAALILLWIGSGFARQDPKSRLPQSLNLVAWGMTGQEAQKALKTYNPRTEISSMSEEAKAGMRQMGTTIALSDTSLAYDDSLAGRKGVVELKFSAAADSLAQIRISFESPDTILARILGDTLVKLYGPPLDTRTSKKRVLFLFNLKTVVSIWKVPAGVLTYILFFKGDDIAVASLQYSPRSRTNLR